MTEQVRTAPRRVNRDILAHAYGLIPRLETGLPKFEALLRWTAGPVIAGIKPAALVRLPGGLVGDVWDRGGAELCRTLNLSILTLRESSTGTLVLLYRRKILARKTGAGAGSRYLRALGYPGGRLEGCLSFLKKRFGEPAFPHEVGVFLGYPLEDVIGFSRGEPSPYSCRGYWRVYGRPEKAERTFAYMDAARLNLVQEIFTGMDGGARFGAVTGMPENIKPLRTGIAATSLGNFRSLIRRRVI
jgi:hypothetical protein